MFPKISRKPITCYKVVLKTNDGYFRTGVRHQSIRTGDEIKASEKYPIIKGIFKKYLEGEVVHAFLDKNKAIAHVYEYAKLFKKPYTIIESTIPSYTPYWVSDNLFYFCNLNNNFLAYNTKEIGATKMIVGKEINFEKFNKEVC